MVKRSEIGVLGAALRRSHGFSAESEALGLSPRVRRAASSLQMPSHAPLAASRGRRHPSGHFRPCAGVPSFATERRESSAATIAPRPERERSIALLPVAPRRSGSGSSARPTVSATRPVLVEQSSPPQLKLHAHSGWPPLPRRTQARALPNTGRCEQQAGGGHARVVGRNADRDRAPGVGAEQDDAGRLVEREHVADRIAQVVHPPLQREVTGALPTTAEVEGHREAPELVGGAILF